MHGIDPFVVGSVHSNGDVPRWENAGVHLRLAGPYRSADGAARLVLRAADGAAFEVVAYQLADHDALCLSAQAGCGYSCRHCATTFAEVAFQRSLTCEELVASAETALRAIGWDRVRTIDFSGIGDASRNWANVSAASQELLQQGRCSRVTVTSVAPQRWVRDRIAGGWLPDKVRISLHGATRERRRLVVTHGDDPVRVIGLWEQLAARVPVELNYVLHAGNTSAADADAVLELLSGRRFAALRLTPLTEVPGSELVPVADAHAFATALRSRLPDLPVEWFQPLGVSAEAACGQLRVRVG